MRIVASCTTLPNRYDQLSSMITSLQQQTRPFDAMYLTIPKISKRFNTPYPDLPDHIKHKCIVVYCDIDYGPLCKLYGALVSEKKPDTMIITVDDDCHYSPNLVQSLVNHDKKDAVICGSGALLSSFGIHFLSYYNNHSHDYIYNAMWGFHVPPEGRSIDLLYGYGGVLYRRGYFPDVEDLFQYPLLHHAIFCNDDVLISGYLKKQNIKILIFPDIGHVRTNEKEKDALSYDFFKMLYRLDDAIQILKTYGFYKTIEGASFNDSVVGKYSIGVIIIVFIIFCTFLLQIYID